MILLEPDETPYDLRWRMLGIPVRVHPMFWLITLVMGWSALEDGPEYLATWVAAVFVSILVHELGHVLMGRAFGASGRIILYGFGGLAVGSNRLSRRWQRIAVAFAGPLAGFVFLGAIFVSLFAYHSGAPGYYLARAMAIVGLPIPAGLGTSRDLGITRLGDAALFYLTFINLLWGLVNLLPVWPLDGGQISREICVAVKPWTGVRLSLGISVAVAGLLAVHSIMAAQGRPLLPLRFGSLYSALLFGLLAIQSFQLLQQANSGGRGGGDPWER